MQCAGFSQFGIGLNKQELIKEHPTIETLSGEGQDLLYLEGIDFDTYYQLNNEGICVFLSFHPHSKKQVKAIKEQLNKAFTPITAIYWEFKHSGVEYKAVYKADSNPLLGKYGMFLLVPKSE